MDEAHVREFCGLVESELTRLLDEKAALEEEVRRAHEQARAQEQARADEHAADTEGEVRPGSSHVQAVYILSKAQQTADQYVASAQEYSREIAQDARRHRDEILADARDRASSILDEAQARAEHATDRAPLAAEPLTMERQRELEAELVYLRTFSDVCRTHLRAYLESLTRTIDEWDRAQETALTVARLAPPRLNGQSAAPEPD